MRLAANQTQADVAERVGVDRTLVHRWETSERAPRVDQIPALAAALGRAPADVLEAFGVVVGARRIDRLPTGLLADLLALTPQELEVVARVARGLRATQAHPGGQAQP